jgi:hypothetical protein
VIFPLRSWRGVVALRGSPFSSYLFSLNLDHVIVMIGGMSLNGRGMLPVMTAAVMVLLLAAGCSDSKKKPAASSPETAQPVAAPAEPPKPKEPPAELKVKWEVGKRYVIREATTQETSMIVPNQPEPTKTGNTMQRDFALTVLSQRPEGGHIMEVEFVATKVEAKMGDKVVAGFDSTADIKTDRTNALAKMHRKVIGGKFTYVTDAAGNIEKVEGVSNLVRKVTLGLDRNTATALKAQYGEDQLKRMELVPEGLPTQAVAPGDSWTNRFDLPIGGAMAKFEVKSTLSGYEERNSKRSAIIKNSGTAQINLGNTPAAAVMTFENVKLDGEVVFDPEKGQVHASTMNVSMDIKVTANGQAVSQPVVIKSTKNLVEVMDAPKAADPAAKAK